MILVRVCRAVRRFGPDPGRAAGIDFGQVWPFRLQGCRLALGEVSGVVWRRCRLAVRPHRLYRRSRLEVRRAHLL